MKKHLKLIPVYLIIIVLLLFIIPVKVATNNLSTDKSDYYIISYVSGGCTDAGAVILWETSNTDYTAHDAILLTGKEPKKEVGYNIYNSNTQFVVYGTLNDNDILEVTKWEIYGEVKGGIHKKYLTIFDYPWCDWLYKDDY